MNSGSQGQPTAGQPLGTQQSPRQHIFRPEQMRNLPDTFTIEEKTKWETALRKFWLTINDNPPDSTLHLEAKKKLIEFSTYLTGKMQTFRAQQGSGIPVQRPPQMQLLDNSQQPPQLKTAMVAAPPKYPPKILEHVESFPYVLPPHFVVDTPEALEWIKSMKQKYMSGLGTMDNAKFRVQQLKALEKRRNDAGNPLNMDEERECREKIAQAQKAHNEASGWIEKFRASQVNFQKQRNGKAGDPSQPQAPSRPQLNPQQQPSSASQNTQAVTAAIEAARNQQLGAARLPMQANAQLGQVGSQIGNRMGQGPPIKVEGGGSASMNTAIQQSQQGLGQTNSPPSVALQSTAPQSTTSNEPRALSHQAALQTAARTYSSGQTSGTPNVMGHSHPQPPVLPRESQTSLTTKMPIPKALPERATAQPQPVAMPQQRPTYTGGTSGTTNGPMGQPVMSKPPPFSLRREGERVLNKKKLDELVRQVTGGGEALESGESLTAEVEESILTVADNFVDQVLQSACNNAKERGSQALEIRDIQLTLERGYNIRIPGYASDEIRTVRKIQPSAAWISKMSAVQAAKVTGGKGTD